MSHIDKFNNNPFISKFVEKVYRKYKLCNWKQIIEEHDRVINKSSNLSSKDRKELINVIKLRNIYLERDNNENKSE